ncbi:MAG: MoaD/ThiS family protein [Dehalococcoidia bacterium]
MAVVVFPTPLQRYTAGEKSVTVPGSTLRQLINNLDERFPGLKAHLIDPEDDDKLMPGLAAIIGMEAVEEGLRTRVEEDDEVHFLPAIAGGGS